MSKPSLYPVDFRVMYNEATKKESILLKKVADELELKRKEALETILQLDTDACQIVTRFLDANVFFLDEITKSYIGMKAFSLHSDISQSIQNAKKLYDTYLKEINFANEENRVKLLKTPPFKDEFDRVLRSISHCQKLLEQLKIDLNNLISKKGLSQTRILRKKAEEFIAKVLDTKSDPMGIYHELLIQGSAKIRFIEKKLENVPYKYDYYSKGTVIFLYDVIIDEKIPFFVFCNFAKFATELRKEYGTCILECSYYSDFFKDFIFMIKSLINNIQLAPIYEITENELNGMRRSSYEQVYKCVLQLKA